MLYLTFDHTGPLDTGTNNVYIINFLPHPAGGEAASRVGPKIVLDHVRVYVYKNYVCALWFSSPLVVYDAIDNASSSRAHEDWEIATERLAMLATRACLA